jgi:site-specific DNA-adenine methylase
VASIQGIEGGSLLLLLELAVKKRGVWIGSFLLEKDEKEKIEGWYQGTMESIEIKSKRNIRRKRYQKR